MRLQLLLVSFCGFWGTVSHAQDVDDVTVWSGVSTFGLTLEGGYQITPDWRARAGLMGGLSLNETQTQDGNSYDVDAQLGALTMMLDYSPSGSDWRVSGGLLLSQTAINSTVRGSVASPIEYNGQSFSSGTATSVAEFNRTVAPVITAGYDYPIGENWVMSSEVGAVLMGGFDIEISGDSATLQDAIDNDDDVQQSRKDAADLAYYPYVSVSIGYRF